MNDSLLGRIGARRRQELLLAAYELAGRSGINALTIEQVARHTGASKGIVHHYFASKDNLIEQTVRYANAYYRRAIVERLKQAASPSERLWSVIAPNFAPDIFQPNLCGGWMSLTEAAKINPRLARIYEITNRRLLMHIVMPLRHLLPRSDVEAAADALMGLMDGCWILAAAEPEVTRKAALSVIAEYLRTHVPRFDMSVVNLDD